MCIEPIKHIKIIMDLNTKIRPFHIAKILYEQTDEDHPLSTSEIVQILLDKHDMETYRKTIKADIELLRRVGMDIHITRSSENQYFMANRRFSIPELKLLSDAVESAKFISKRKSKELTEKLSSLTDIFSAEKIKRNVDVERRIKTDNEQTYYIIDTINEAINLEKKISFLYFKYNLKKEKELKNDGIPYIFSPYKLVWNGEHYYVVGYSDKHSSIGTFRIDRIYTTPNIIDVPAVTPPDHFDMDYYLNTMFRMYDGERCTVELLCDNDIVDSIIDRFGEQIDIIPYDKDRFSISVEVVVSHIFFSWVFGFEGKVKILSPSDILQKYNNIIQSSL